MTKDPKRDHDHVASAAARIGLPGEPSAVAIREMALAEAIRYGHGLAQSAGAIVDMAVEFEHYLTVGSRLSPDAPTP